MIFVRLVAGLVAAMALSFLLAVRPAMAEEKAAIPDFTQGGKKPDTHDWVLGANRSARLAARGGDPPCGREAK